MLRLVALLITDVSEELSASFIMVTKVGELGTAIAVTSNRCTLLVFLRSVHRFLVTASVVPSSPILATLIKYALSSSETSVLTRPRRRNIPECAILQTKQRKTNQPTKLHKQWRTYYSQWTQRRNRRRNKVVPDTGLGDLLSCETSGLSHHGPGARSVTSPYIETNLEKLI
jgi:hypothetical protein